MATTSRQKVQTNLKLAVDRARALDVAAAIEQKEKATIVEEALALREELMGRDYRALLQAALDLRFSPIPLPSWRRSVPSARRCLARHRMARCR